jgi:hypothetical protein
MTSSTERAVEQTARGDGDCRTPRVDLYTKTRANRIARTGKGTMTVAPTPPPTTAAGTVRLPGRPRLVEDPAITAMPGSQASFISLTARVVDRLLRLPGPPADPRELALAIDDAVLAVTTRQVARARAVTETAARADLPPRAEVVRAHGAAARYLRLWRPAPDADLVYAGAHVAAAHQIVPADLVRLTAATAPAGRRLAWARDPGDLSAGLLLDRLNPTHLPDSAWTAWVAAQVDADRRLGEHLAGPAFAGVRVLLPLAPAASLHVLPDGRRHQLGGCPDCTTDPVPLSTGR